MRRRRLMSKKAREMKMRRRDIFRLVPDHLSDDTLQAVDALRQDAKSGKLVGLAFVGIYKGGEYVVDTAGEALRNTTATIGMTSMLADQLRQRERGK